MRSPTRIESMASRFWRGAAVLGSIAVVFSCSDQTPVAPRKVPPGFARLSVSPVYQLGAPGGPTIRADKAIGVLIGPAGDSIVATAKFNGDSATLEYAVPIVGSSAKYTLDLTELDANGTAVFHGTQTYTLKPGDNTGLAAPVMAYSAPDAKLAVLKVGPSSATLKSGEASTFAVSGTASNGQAVSPIIVAWSTKDPAVATVDQSGTVQAGQFQGTTYVVARTFTGLADSALITVHAAVDHIVMAPASLDVVRGKTGAVTAELRDAGNHLIDDRIATFTSADPSIATVTAFGVVQGVKTGSTTITAAAEGKTASVKVSVVSPVDHIALSPTSLTFKSLNETQTLTASIVPRAGASVDGIALTLTNSAPSVATVDASGHVTSKANGSGMITAIADGITATAAFTVQQTAASIKVSPKIGRVDALGSAQTFTAAVTDALGNSLPSGTVSWSSSNSSIAVVGSDGTAVGWLPGTVTITATAGGLSDNATFVVAQVPKVITPSVLPTSIQVGQIANLYATGTDANGNAIPLGGFTPTWTSATPSIATVSGTVVTGVSPGTASLVATFNGISASVSLTVTPGPGSAPTGRILIYGPSMTPAFSSGFSLIPLRRPSTGDDTNGVSSASPNRASRPARGPIANGALASVTFSGFQNEQTLAQSAGLQVTVADSATWSHMTTADFAAFSAIVFGDPTCSTSANYTLSGAIANLSTWGPAITGPVVLIGTDYIYHQQQGGLLMAQNALKWVSGTTRTGLFMSLSCYFFSASSGTPISFLTPLGSFKVVGQNYSSDVVKILQPTHPIFQGVTEASLSFWGESIHEMFTAFPSSFVPLATAGDGTPYIIAKP